MNHRVKGNNGRVSRGATKIGALTSVVVAIAASLPVAAHHSFSAEFDASKEIRATGSVTALTGDRSFAASGLGGFTAGWFTLGRLTWTSGPNVGRVAEVASHAVVGGERRLTLLEAPVRPIAPGDDFTVRAGCDKRLETCRDRFANVLNFRGFPHIPGQDTVVRYPNRGDANNGDVL